MTLLHFAENEASGREAVMGGGENQVSLCLTREQQQQQQQDALVESPSFDHHPHSSHESTPNITITQSVNEGFDKKFQDSKKWVSVKSSQSEMDELRRLKDFEEIMQSYANSKLRLPTLEEAKSKILSYRPGAWTEEVGHLKMNDYDVPKTTTILLVGLSGSGKSTLVNRISRVFEDDKFTFNRAQVSYNSAGDGTFFLHEYMIPRGSNSFCLYDTRGLSENSHDNFEMIKSWMTKGVRHGQLVLRDTDSSSARNTMKCKARKTLGSKEPRTVDFVIFVIDAISVLEVMDGGKDMEYYNDLLEECFNYPYLSCKDDKPVVVCTHGDLLSLVDRARVRIHLGELLGVPPTKQIFDIPDCCDPETDLAVVDLLTYSLMHADNNYPVKRSHYKVLGVLMIFIVFLCFFAFWITHCNVRLKNWPSVWHSRFYVKNSSDDAMNSQATPSSKLDQELGRDWYEIRHLWEA